MSASSSVTWSLDVVESGSIGFCLLFLFLPAPVFFSQAQKSYYEEDFRGFAFN